VEEDIEPDPSVEDMIDGVFRSHRADRDTIVGKTRTALNRSRVLESTMDNLLLRSIKEYTGAEIAFSNGWRYGAPVLPGSITMNDVWNIVPTNPPVSVCKLSGMELWKMMEENLEHTFSRNPYMQMGGYVKRCAGLSVYFKVENPKGKRIQEFFIEGKRLDKRKTYCACYLTAQGVPTRYGTERKNLEVRAIDVLTEYVERNAPVTAGYQGGVVPI
jgi:2',3'-cyclic-nucleotide 2'-phosphodiesterase (5'-nucleotidase family)